MLVHVSDSVVFNKTMCFLCLIILFFFFFFYHIVVVSMQELDKQIVDYTSTYVPDDQLEWSLVLEEIKSFIKADGIVSVLHADSNTIVLSHRYTYTFFIKCIV